jgi:hypothetical protein
VQPHHVVLAICASLKRASGRSGLSGQVAGCSCPSKACLSEESAQLQRVRRAARIVPVRSPEACPTLPGVGSSGTER